MAEAFHAHDVEVHLFEMLPHVMAPFGETVAERVEEHLREEGVRLHLDTAVERFVGDEGVTGVETGDEVVAVDLALVGVGVAPNTDLAEAAGTELGETGAIATDEYGRTSVEGAFAAGDCAEARHVVTGEPDHVPLALTANRAGRAIGQTMAGDETPVGEIAGTAVVKAFDLTAARTGIVDEGRAHEAGFDPVSVTITDSSRAHYYPGAEEITITMLGDRESGRVLGATMVGREGVAKRIDTVAVALHEGATVEALSYYDLAYAPPYSPVWDPVLTAAKVLDGKLV
jgi:NADPH-dependent 2,4-dienoyl-CoA reductase/sulfur reductase-like enzyme